MENQGWTEQIDEMQHLDAKENPDRANELLGWAATILSSVQNLYGERIWSKKAAKHVVPDGAFEVSYRRNACSGCSGR